MAGKPGMKGGGGARPNSGPKPKPKPVISPVVNSGSDPKKFLQSVMDDELADPRIRMDAAKALLPFMHQKLGEGGKKDERLNAAKKVATGKFAPVAPPLRLVK